jgi:cephalosporin-C deacetylase
MPFFDLPVEQLREYRPQVREPKDFDDFWEHTLAESRGRNADPIITQVNLGISEFETSDLRFSGFNGDEIAAWLVRPSKPRGIIIEYNGYGGGRGFPHERLWWAAAGFTYIFMDTRGQASMWGSGGVTGDPHGTGPSSNGFMTRGIEDPEKYYYRRVFTDAVMLIDAAQKIDAGADSISLCGGSQGGGIALAAAGLSSDVSAVMPDVPFLCHFDRAVSLTDGYPYREIANYLSIHRDKVEQTFSTLSYFDGVNFAKRSFVPALFSTALMDEICPPSTVFAAKNHYGGEAEITVYPFNGHEGGQGHHFLIQADWLGRTQ